MMMVISFSLETIYKPIEEEIENPSYPEAIYRQPRHAYTDSLVHEYVIKADSLTRPSLPPPTNDRLNLSTVQCNGENKVLFVPSESHDSTGVPALVQA